MRRKLGLLVVILVALFILSACGNAERELVGIWVNDALTDLTVAVEYARDGRGRVMMMHVTREEWSTTDIFTWDSYQGILTTTSLELGGTTTSRYEINRDTLTLTRADGSEVNYDRLHIGTNLPPFPPFPIFSVTDVPHELVGRWGNDSRNIQILGSGGFHVIHRDLVWVHSEWCDADLCWRCAENIALVGLTNCEDCENALCCYWGVGGASGWRGLGESRIVHSFQWEAADSTFVLTPASGWWGGTHSYSFEIVGESLLVTRIGGDNVPMDLLHPLPTNEDGTRILPRMH
jgi:hypothetical protein